MESMEQSSISRYIVAFQEGREPDRAFKSLYEAYGEFAIRNAHLVVKDPEGVKDVVQEVFVRVYRNLHRFDTSKPFKPWFYRILTNECYRYLEKAKRITPMEREVAERTVMEMDFAIDVDDHEELEEALHQLDPRDRLVLVYKYLNRMTEDEIAEATSEKKTAIKARLYKARKRLRAILEGGRRT